VTANFVERFAFCCVRFTVICCALCFFVVHCAFLFGCLPAAHCLPCRVFCLGAAVVLAN